MWITANSKIMQVLATTGKLSGTSSISDYLSYMVKFAELLESHTFLSVVVYDMKVAAQIRFSVGKRLSTFIYSFSHQMPNFGFFPTSTVKIRSRNRSQQAAPPIFRQFNSPAGCQWPNCRFQRLRIVPNCNQPHSQYAHANSPRDIQ